MDQSTRVGTIGDLIAHNLRRIRSVRRLPQSEIAGRMAARGWHWTASKVSLIESGKRGLALDELADLCASLEVPVGDLLDCDGLDVSDEVGFRAQVLSAGHDTWTFSTSPALQEAASAARRAETLRRIEGRIARTRFGSDTSETRATVAARAQDIYGHDVLTERDRVVSELDAMAEDAGVDPDLTEPHVLRREATLRITQELGAEGEALDMVKEMHGMLRQLRASVSDPSKSTTKKGQS